jgi:3-oxoacid CoA-transferase subunit A
MKIVAIKNVLITGDTHGCTADRLDYIQTIMTDYTPKETAVIILGDVGLNYYLSSLDEYKKRRVNSFGFTIYCVRGNHDARPSDVPGMHLVNDDFVKGAVWVQDEYPNIRYFTDWGVYNIQGRRTLVIGGAYSVDKHYRLQQGWQWFANEQMTDYERRSCARNVKERHFDLVLSHTCPASLQPTDLFLSFIDQKSVDNTMEKWMDDLMPMIYWRLHLWGHYHADRIYPPAEKSHVMLYKEIQDLDNLFKLKEKGAL